MKKRMYWHTFLGILLAQYFDFKVRFKQTGLLYEDVGLNCCDPENLSIKALKNV